MDRVRLDEIRTGLVNVMSEWDGDNAGIKEDRAHIASEALTALDNLDAKLEELQSYE